MVYKCLDEENEKPHDDNDIILFMSITKISFDDKVAIPIRELGKPVRTNVRKLYSSLGFESSNKSPKALDHNYHKDSIRPSLILLVETLFKSKSRRKGYVTTSLKDGATEQSTAMGYEVEFQLIVLKKV